MDEICSEEKYRPSSKQQQFKRDFYSQIQRIRLLRERIYSDDIDYNVYYFIQDLIDDLEIPCCIGLEAGREIRIYPLKSQFGVLETVAYWNRDTDETPSPRIISFPRSELWNPLSYTLIIHECFHESRVVNTLMEYFEYTDEEVPESVLEEVCIDLLSLNYMGPAYGSALVNIPEKIGDHDSTEHPSLAARKEYIRQYLEHSENEINGDDNIFSEVIDNVLDTIDSTGSDFSIGNFGKIQTEVEDIMDSADIPRFLDEHDNIHEQLGMAKADDETINQSIQSLFINESDKGIVSLPIKPILLFNILVLVENRSNESVRMGAHESFRKWYVTKKSTSDD